MSEVIFLGADAETFYDTKDKYSLAAKSFTMQEYIEDERFEEIMWAVGEVGTPEDQIQLRIGGLQDLEHAYNWDNVVLVAQNAQFDAAILNDRYGINPRRVLCVMAMCKALGIDKITGSVSLANLCKFFGLPDKGTEVVLANGKRLADFTPPELQAYGGYCIGDVWRQNKIFEIVRPFITKEESLWHSLVNKMYSDAKLSLNLDLLQESLMEIRSRRVAQQQALCTMLGFESIEEVKKYLGSSNKFADLLREEGVEPPMKISPRTGKPTFAFAKSDEGFNALLEHSNERVRLLVETRLGVKSNTEEKRTERMIKLAQLPSGRFRIPHKISGAHTHRLSGVDGINIQNLPSGRVEGQSKVLRQSIVLKDSQGNIIPSSIAAPDSGQIEARIGAFIANDTEMLEVFTTGKCPYSIMAESVYGISRDEIKAGDKAYKMGDESKKQMYLHRQTGKAAVLQLIFGAGAVGFHRSLRDMYGVTDVSPEEAERIHAVYREERIPIVKFWQVCKRILEMLIQGKKGYFGGADGKLFYFDGSREVFGHRMPGIMLPNGTWLTYPGLFKYVDEDTGWEQFAYFGDLSKVRKNPDNAMSYAKRVWFGTLIENLCQSLAFAALKWQAVRINEFVPVCFNVHDEFIIASATNLEGLAERSKAVMETAPPWLRGVRFECEYGISDNYGDT